MPNKETWLQRKQREDREEREARDAKNAARKKSTDAGVAAAQAEYEATRKALGVDGKEIEDTCYTIALWLFGLPLVGIPGIITLLALFGTLNVAGTGDAAAFLGFVGGCILTAIGAFTTFVVARLVKLIIRHSN